MALIGPFEITYKKKSICFDNNFMLTNYILCISFPDQIANVVVTTYLKEIYCKFGGSNKIQPDNGGEFKNSLFSEVVLWFTIKYIFSSPYQPQANERIKYSLKFLKKCIQKFTLKGNVELDEVVNIVCVAHNYFPCSQSQKPSFFPMFAADVYIHTLTTMLHRELKYFSDTSSMFSLEILREALNDACNKCI